MSFIAVYPGRCNAGDDPIREGDLIAEDTGDGYSHVRCLATDDEPDLQHRPTVCPSCNLEHAGGCF